MTYSQWNIDQSDFPDGQPDGTGYGARPAQADPGGRRQDVPDYGMHADGSGFGEEPRRSLSGIQWSAGQGGVVEDQRQDGPCLDVQASQDPFRPEQSVDSTDYGEQVAPAGYGDEPQLGGAESQWR
jgi:hypothetical protein